MRFFFDLVQAAGGRQHDHDGVELPDIEVAQIEAAELLKRARRASASSRWEAVAITTASGELLAIMRS